MLKYLSTYKANRTFVIFQMGQSLVIFKEENIISFMLTLIKGEYEILSKCLVVSKFVISNG